MSHASIESLPAYSLQQFDWIYTVRREEQLVMINFLTNLQQLFFISKASRDGKSCICNCSKEALFKQFSAIETAWMFVFSIVRSFGDCIEGTLIRDKFRNVKTWLNELVSIYYFFLYWYYLWYYLSLMIAWYSFEGGEYLDIVI